MPITPDNNLSKLDDLDALLHEIIAEWEEERFWQSRLAQKEGGYLTDNRADHVERLFGGALP